MRSKAVALKANIDALITQLSTSTSATQVLVSFLERTRRDTLSLLVGKKSQTAMGLTQRTTTTVDASNLAGSEAERIASTLPDGIKSAIFSMDRTGVVDTQVTDANFVQFLAGVKRRINRLDLLVSRATTPQNRAAFGIEQYAERKLLELLAFFYPSGTFPTIDQ